ncbi:hypothetical protein RhiirB3_454908 [Rhizophagus irregularis]|nr:hypothetical protein RhiirB3_454908 [Rhizophagus irregularis]
MFKNELLIKYTEFGKDEKSTETAVEESLAQESLKRVWKIKNFKEIYRAKKVSYLDTPPQRIYLELGGIRMYQHPKKPNNDKVRSSSKGVALTENQVVDEIDKYNRKGVEDDATISKITSKKLHYHG